MKVKFFENHNLQRKFEIDLEAIPRKDDRFSTDCIKGTVICGIVTDVVWRLYRYRDSEVAIYYKSTDGTLNETR